MWRYTSILIFVIISTAPVLPAEPSKILWVEPIKQVSVPPEEQSVAATFIARNMSQSNITILSAEKSCDCLDVSYPLSPIGPGQTAEIAVIFKLTGETGKLDRHILVTTSDQPQLNQTLRLVVNVADALEVRPGVLHWNASEGVSVQSVTVRPIDENETTIRSIHCSNSRYRIDIDKKRSTGSQYVLNIHPVASSGCGNAIVVVRGDYKSHALVRYIYLSQLKRRE